MSTIGPELHRPEECEAVLRTLPGWFGIEEALLMYAQDTDKLPTFAIEQEGRIVSFLSLMEHFPESWEVHCMAVHAALRKKGHGTALFAQAERWLVEKGARFLQVKTVAHTSKNAEYAETRKFYLARGFTPLEIFPLLWAPQNPALQLVKTLNTA
jgi:GNAT superfamily N-acetyltransferase